MRTKSCPKVHKNTLLLTPLIYEDHPILLPPPSLTCLSPPTPHSNCSFCCPISLTKWVHSTFNVHFYLRIIWIYTCRALVPERPWYVFYAKRPQVYWGLTHNVVFYWYSDLISHTQNTQTYTAHSGANRLTHPYIIYIYTTCNKLTTAAFITLND